MAYTHVADPTASGMAGRIEHVRALQHNRKGDVTESQRAADDAEMLYSIHTYSRLNLQPALALQRGREAFEAARALGDRWLETLAAGGMAMTCLQIGGAEECGAWLDQAATAAMAVASTPMARRLEMWRGAYAAARGDVGAMDRHYRRAAELAGQKNIGECCQAWGHLAFESARIALTEGDLSLVAGAREAAQRTLDLSSRLKGRLPWVAQAHAALGLAAMAEGDQVTAADEARAALDIEGETHVLYFAQSLWTAARLLVATGEPEGPALAEEIGMILSFVAMSFSDPEMRQKWFSMPMARDLAEIVGFDPNAAQAPTEEGLELTEADLALLRDMASGTAASRPGDVDDLLGKLGVESEHEAIQYAIKAGVSWQ
jgi:hypothetical protein